MLNYQRVIVILRIVIVKLITRSHILRIVILIIVVILRLVVRPIIVIRLIVVIRANTPIRPHPFYAVHLGISNVRLYIHLGRSTRVSREYKFPTPVKLLHSLTIFNKILAINCAIFSALGRISQVCLAPVRAPLRSSW